ncbi:hypothetical protein EMUCRT_0040 [Ehrlichia cf. muris str. EmCRT]|uniref:Uncharacterized protein n=1 Tax=Ehrlichia cf. muris str. EmCRT TaxID=1359167 RepID=A0A0F3NG34_9RICK|nr:hypothetical protein EMUCRT_0040 [Ehrlichia cf. muris str. EmCRT]
MCKVIDLCIGIDQVVNLLYVYPLGGYCLSENVWTLLLMKYCCVLK